MNTQTIELNQTTCDKCGGDGKNFALGSHEFFGRWRRNLGVSQARVGLVLRVSKEQISNFENGRLNFGESRQRKLAEILSGWNSVGEEK